MRTQTFNFFIDSNSRCNGLFLTAFVAASSFRRTKSRAKRTSISLISFTFLLWQDNPRMSYGVYGKNFEVEWFPYDLGY